MAPRRILVLTEMYPPEIANTSKFMAGIVTALATQSDVHVLAAQPTYDSRGTKAARREREGRVTIERLVSTTFDRHNLVLRLINTATLLLSFAIVGIQRVRNADALLVVTNPPFMPLLAELLAWSAGIPCVVLVHDVYPHALAAAGLTKRSSLLWRVLHRVFGIGFRNASRIVALADDMRQLLIREFEVDADRVSVIPNWGDENDVYPDAEAGTSLRERLGLGTEFVVQVMGNMGRTHGLDVVLDAAERLKDDGDIRFLLVGGGKQAGQSRAEIDRRKLSNVIFIPPVPSDDLRGMLNVADVAVITFRAGMSGVSVPSRIYNCLAAGQVLIAVADASSEPAQLLARFGCGVSVSSGDGAGLAREITRLRSDIGLRRDMSARGREAFLQHYRYGTVADIWRGFFSDFACKA